MIRCWNGWNFIICFWCLTILYVVIFCDGCIILYGIFGIQNIYIFDVCLLQKGQTLLLIQERKMFEIIIMN